MSDQTTIEVVLASESTVGNPIIETVTVLGTVPIGPRGADGSASGVSDGDKGDITVSSDGTVWSIDAGAVGTDELAAGAVTAAKVAADVATQAELDAEASSRAAADTALDGRLDPIEALGAIAQLAGANFVGSAPIAVDEVTAAVLATLPDGAVNGFVVKLNGASAGYGKGQAFLVLEEGAGDATDATASGSVLFRVDERGSIGTNGGVHIATGIRKTTADSAALWIQPYQDVPHIILTRDDAASTSAFLQITDETNKKLVVVGPAGLIATRNTADTADAAVIAAGDAGTAGFRAIFASISAATGCLALGATSGQTADMLRLSLGATVYTRFNKDGYFMTRKVAAPADSEVATSEASLWWDNTAAAPKLKIKGKDSAGTVSNQTVAQDSAVVHTTGDETVAGVKTFSSTPIAPAYSASGLTGAVAGARFVGATSSGAPASGTFAVGDFVVDRSGQMWVCTVAGTPGTWVAPGSGRELGYAEITASQSGITGVGAANKVAITGLSVTVTVGSRPIKIIARTGNSLNTTADNGIGVAIVDTADTATLLTQGGGVTPIANGAISPHVEVRKNPAAGSKTYAVYAWAVVGGSATFVAGAQNPAFIQVVEV